MTVLRAAPLTREAFAPFGDVIEIHTDARVPMNEGTFERFDALATVDTGGDARIGIVRCREASGREHTFDFVERHPLGSQAFVPLAPFVFAVVVAPPGDTVDRTDLRAFVTDGTQGINYRRGTWHMPLIAFATGQAFLVIDRGNAAQTCDYHRLDPPVTLVVDQS